MRSYLDEVLANFRQRLIQRDERSIKEVLQAYRLIEDELKKHLRVLLTEIDDSIKRGETNIVKILRIKRIKKLLDELNTVIESFGEPVEKIVIREQIAAIAEAITETQALGKIQGTNINARLPKRAIENAVGMMGDGSPVLDYFKTTITPEVAETLRKELIKAAALGTNYNQISRKLLQTAQISKQRAMMITRTEVNRLRRETTRQIYERNSKHIEAWEWLAVKSAKTCILCLAMDGKIFELKKPFPQHINCRCRMIPVLKGKLRQPRLLGAEWFEQQPADIKENLLGIDAFAEWERSRRAKGRALQLRHFVTEKFNKRFGWSIARRPLIEATDLSLSKNGHADWIMRPDEKSLVYTELNNIDKNAERLALKVNGISSVKIAGFGETEFDVLSQQYIGETTSARSATNKPDNYLRNERRAKIRLTLQAAKKLSRTALFEFTAGKPNEKILTFLRTEANTLGTRVIILSGGKFYEP